MGDGGMGEEGECLADFTIPLTLGDDANAIATLMDSKIAT